MHLLKRPLSILVALLLVGYAAAAAGMFFLQRNILFDTVDTGNLATAGTLAIEGSTRIVIKTSDGEELAGWYLAPQADQPVFLFMHGKRGELEQRDERWRKIRDHGAGVLAFSYRGFPGSTGAPSESGLHLDALAAYNWLRERHAAEDIVLHGYSLGTAVAIHLATEVPASALILEAPFTAIVDVAAERYPWLPVHFLMVDQFRSYDEIQNVKMPLLIVHGNQDKSVPYEQAQRLYARANEPKTFVSMPGSTHVSLVQDGLYSHIWSFLQQVRQRMQ
ncbi:C [Candidatus Filomicrobium marinum]|uniref:C n=1 Tax=Candidatus Filomicrobium marinum TaxID=1608628 RepID=A0A0D6J9G0_9HYPH|nr:alpha/beta hydrolase [Candidatus Filomicrobium marinum]CFW98207.1 C [Candidatus Filomicrobium marinum] [Candidatus Filomicrobium marinum]CPR14863.1 C [Candidatus Filomicrobium marinum] [Candidatus Filomicrobium marinum]